MKKLTLICFLLSALFLVSCNREEVDKPLTPETAVSILTANSWKMDKITDLNGNALNLSALPPKSIAFFGVNIQFNEDKTVLAIDPVARKVENGGSWDLIDNSKTLDIDLGKDFKGKYPINKLARSRMSLRNTMQYEGISFEVYLELVPAL